MSRTVKIVITLLIPLAFILAWAAGELKNKEVVVEKLSAISTDITGLVQIERNLYQGHSLNNPDEKLYIAISSQPGYGGLTRVASVVDSKKKIQYVSIFDSDDTLSYLENIVSQGLLDKFTGQTIDKLPEVDVISRATLSSDAVIKGMEESTQKIGAAFFGMPAKIEKRSISSDEIIKIISVCIFFIAAYFLAGSRFRANQKARNLLFLFSIIVIGFLLGTQFSLSTLVLLMSGSWLHGIASYGALVCLVLAIVVYLITRKNIFCTYICPFGAIQEGLGQITHCRPPIQYKWMNLIARSWVLIVILAALFYKSSSSALYEPYGMAFTFIGSDVIFGLTVLILLSSLLVRRPWCNLFCPTKSIIYYIGFARRAFTPAKKKPVVKEETVINTNGKGEVSL